MKVLYEQEHKTYGHQYDQITPTLQSFIKAQPLFFVATAPLSEHGHVNLSPKGYDTFCILSSNQVAYLDLTGSGNETSAHLAENGRITAFLQGLQALGDTPSLIKSDILMGIAEAYAQCGEEQKALHYIGLAQEHFPDYPEGDQSYIYAECGLTTLYQWEGKMYLELVDHFTDRGYQQRASDALMKSIGATSLNDRCTNETIIYQADAARVLGELSIYAGSLRQSVQMAVGIGSKKRYSETLQVYQRTPNPWIKEPQIQLLARDVFKQLPTGKAIQ